MIYNSLTLKFGLRESLNVIQRKCARICLNLHPRHHVGNDEFRRLSWLPFPQRVSFFNLIHAFKVRAGTSPPSIWNRVSPALIPCTLTSYNLRQSATNFSLARCSSPVGPFCRRAESEWNSLTRDLKEVRSLSAFKTGLKRYLNIE